MSTIVTLLKQLTFYKKQWFSAVEKNDFRELQQKIHNISAKLKELGYQRTLRNPKLIWGVVHYQNKALYTSPSSSLRKAKVKRDELEKVINTL